MYKLAFEFNKRIPVSIPAMIDPSQRTNIIHDLYDNFVRYNSDIPHPRPSLMGFKAAFKDDTLNVVEGLPRPTKRISAIMRGMSIKLKPADITRVGNWLNNVSSAAVACDLTITDHVYGHPEDYGHQRSCWWTDFWEARDVLVYNGGGALLAYQDDKLIGRAWHCPDPTGNMVIFNPYGLQSSYTWAKLVSSVITGTQTRLTEWEEGVENDTDDDGNTIENEISEVVYFNNPGNVGYVYNPLEVHQKGIIPAFWSLPPRKYVWKYEQYFECRSCGTRRPQSELDRHNGMCDECADNEESNAERVRCTCCGVYVEPEETFYLTSGEAHCSNCYTGCAVHTEQGEVYPRGWRPAV